MVGFFVEDFKIEPSNIQGDGPTRAPVRRRSQSAHFTASPLFVDKEVKQMYLTATRLFAPAVPKREPLPTNYES